MSQVCHFLVRLSLLERTIFFVVCKAVKIHTCTNMYPGWGWSETLMLTFLQTCVRLRQQLTRVQPGMVYKRAAAKHCWARGSRPLWVSSSTWQCKGTYYPAAERVHEGGRGLHLSVLFLLYALAPWNTPQCCCLVRSGLKTQRSRLWCLAGQEWPVQRLGTNEEAGTSSIPPGNRN